MLSVPFSISNSTEITSPASALIICASVLLILVNRRKKEVVIPRVDVDEDSEEEYCISVEEEDAPDGIFNKKRPAYAVHCALCGDRTSCRGDCSRGINPEAALNFFGDYGGFKS